MFGCLGSGLGFGVLGFVNMVLDEIGFCRKWFLMFFDECGV